MAAKKKIVSGINANWEQVIKASLKGKPKPKTKKSAQTKESRVKP